MPSGDPAVDRAMIALHENDIRLNNRIISVEETVASLDNAALRADIDQNTADIAANTISITANEGNITANTNNISSNLSDINENTSNISQNTIDISNIDLSLTSHLADNSGHTWVGQDLRDSASPIFSGGTYDMDGSTESFVVGETLSSGGPKHIEVNPSAINIGANSPITGLPITMYSSSDMAINAYGNISLNTLGSGDLSLVGLNAAIVATTTATISAPTTNITGNVEIGGVASNNDNAQLNVKSGDAASISKALNLVNENTSSGSGVDFVLGCTTSIEAFANGLAVIRAERQSDGSADLSLLLSPGSSSAPSTRLYVDGSTGNVGMGTTSPTHRLDVNADSIRVRSSQSPASSGTGEQGEIAWDSNYIYICTATNTWKRAALTGGY
jgi:hypothetical protein